MGNERRKKRLDKEMKQKELAAAVERGKFDEAFHKQSEINKELLHKKHMEPAVKDTMVHRIHEKDQKDTKKLMKKISDLRERSKKELDEKKKETQFKSIQLNATQINSTELKSIQLDATQINSTQP